jgi:hypothetical protein
LLYTPAATVSHQGEETGAMVAGPVAAVDSSVDLDDVVGDVMWGLRSLLNYSNRVGEIARAGQLRRPPRKVHNLY